MQEKKVLSGFAIAVLDKGFVYIGDCEHDGEWLIISNAKNLRYWGTKKGLGELALEGPQKETKLDDVGTVRAPAHSVISIIDTEASLWKS